MLKAFCKELFSPKGLDKFNFRGALSSNKDEGGNLFRKLAKDGTNGPSRIVDGNASAWLPEATGARWGKDIPLSDSTGLDSYTRYIEYAEAAYIAIRNSSDDVAAIARNTGWQQYRIQRVKNHLFNNRHQLDDAFRQFDADPDIADAWARLQRDNFVPEDIRLLEHEYFESRFESIFQTNYRDAHDATIRSGRTWNPNP